MTMAETVLPTCTEQGYDIHKCTVCGEEYTDNYVDSLNQEHRYMARIVLIKIEIISTVDEDEYQNVT